MTVRVGPKIDHFNYRLVVVPTGEEETPEFWSVREVYYDAEDTVLGYSEAPVPLAAESYEGIREELLLFVEAQVHPAWHVEEERWVPRELDPSDA